MSKRKWIWTAVALAIFLVVGWSLRPRRVVVEGAVVERGSMETTAVGRGETRIRDRFVITAPVAGRVERIAFREGDRTREGETVIRMMPLPLSESERRQYTAVVSESEAALRAAIASLKGAIDISANARAELKRAEAMYAKGIVSRQALDAAMREATTAAHDVEAQRGRVESAKAAVDAARASLVAANIEPGASIDVTSPVEGTVIRIAERSERIVGRGEMLAVIGDPSQIEGVIDLLSEDAIAVRPGSTVTIERWGGDKLLRARVRTVEPGAFMKVSALGIEEQRVHVIVDLLDRDVRLGDAYRIEASVVTWSSPSALKVPLSALVRDGSQWAVFRVTNGRAALSRIAIGHRNEREAEVLRGLAEDEVVVVHPPAALESGTRVKAEIPASGTDATSPDR